MKGGCDSGFHHVTPDKYEPRLLHFRCTDKRHVELVEVKLSRNALNSEDVYILDNGLEAFQWNGKLSNKNERYHVICFYCFILYFIFCFKQGCTFLTTIRIRTQWSC